MCGQRLRRSVATALIAVAGAGFSGFAGATAASAAALRPAASSIAGSYQASFPGEASASALVVTLSATSTVSGTFAFTDYGDFGNWIASGTYVSFMVASSASGHDGRVLLGRMTSTGISPGAYSLAGVASGAWTAVRDVPPPAIASLTSTARPEGAVPAKVAGSYAVTFPDVPNADTLVLTNAVGSTKQGTFAFTTLGDSGHWVTMGKRIAMGVSTGPEAGITFIATLNLTGIGTVTKPGLYVNPILGTFHWYATKAA